MLTNTWNQCFASICSITFKDKTGDKIGSGTGFKVRNTLVTNNHVYVAPGADKVELRFVREDGFTDGAIKTISYSDFKTRLLIGDGENGWDYAILKLDDTEFAEIPPLELSDSSQIKIGHQVAVFGFQFDQSNLSLKQGVISSRDIKNKVKYLQIDASVNNGNSGGPLIDIQTNKVIGIVTRKHTGLTIAFDNLLTSIHNNLQALNAAAQGGTIMMMGINPIQALTISQQQLKIAATELKRSANVGIGFAFELDLVLDYFNHL